MPRKMNEIEQRFWDSRWHKNFKGHLKAQVQIGPYVVDFVFENDVVVEIDGHEHHKTKEQRYDDYTRERYFQKRGYTVVRFMGTEVFLDADKCFMEMIEIWGAQSSKRQDEYWRGWREGVEQDKA